MKTIAALTLFYLPATFTCSLFGTNFFALDTNPNPLPVVPVGGSTATGSAPASSTSTATSGSSPEPDNTSTFVVSGVWWIYLVAAVPLTAVTFLVFLLWNRNRNRWMKRRGKGGYGFNGGISSGSSSSSSDSGGRNRYNVFGGWLDDWLFRDEGKGRSKDIEINDDVRVSDIKSSKTTTQRNSPSVFGLGIEGDERSDKDIEMSSWHT